MQDYLEVMTTAYLEAALFSSCDDAENYFDEDYCVDDFCPYVWEAAREDCQKFMDLATEKPWAGSANLWEAANNANTIDRIGRDFWLTRNHHGSGFWDGEYDDCGDELTQIVSDHFGEKYVYLSDDDDLDIE